YSFYPPLQPPPRSTLFPYTTLFRSRSWHRHAARTSPPLRTLPSESGSRGGCRGFFRAENLPLHVMNRDRSLFLFQNGAQTECARSEEHTSELQSRENLVCRLLLEKK